MARVLIVTHETDRGASFVRHLESQGHRATAVADGEAAGRLMFDLTEEFELILCDLDVSSRAGEHCLEGAHSASQGLVLLIAASGVRTTGEPRVEIHQWDMLVRARPTPLSELDEVIANGFEQLEGARRRTEEADRHLDSVVAGAGDAWRGRQRTMVHCELLEARRLSDQCGYKVADQILQAVSRRLEQASRFGGVVQRYGGDEFLLVMPPSEPPSRAAVASVPTGPRAT